MQEGKQNKAGHHNIKNNKLHTVNWLTTLQCGNIQPDNLPHQHITQGQQLVISKANTFHYSQLSVFLAG